MAKYPGLVLRGRRFYLRKAVDADIRATLGDKEIWKSLRTSDRKEAIPRYHKEAAALAQVFQQYREKLARDAQPPLDALTDDQIRLIGDVYFRHLLEEDEEWRIEGFDTDSDDGRERAFDEYMADVEDIADINRRSLATGAQPEFIRDEAREVLTWEGVNLKLSEASPSWPKLINALLKATVKASEAKRQRNAGDVVETPPAPSPISQPKADTAPTLKDARDFYVTEKVAGDEFNRNKNVQRVDRLVRYIHAALKDVPALPDWTPQHAYKVRDWLLNDKKMKPATVRRELNTAKGIFSLYRDRLLRSLDNPFSRMELPASAVSDKDSRDPLSPEQIAAIRKLVIAQNNRELGLIWRLLEITGCRLAEVTGLRKVDVVVDGDQPHLRIVGHPKRSIKTNSSIRDVPLVGDGLAAAKEALALADDGEALFLRYSNGGRGANGASALLMQRVRQVTKDAKLSVHSLRHSFADRCDLAGVSPMDKSAMLGHLSGNASERHYGSRQAKLVVLTRAMKKAAGIEDDQD